MSRPSIEPSIDYGENVRAAKTLQIQFDGSDLQLRKKVVELNTHNLDGGDGLELENRGNRDPAVVATEVTNQLVSLICINSCMLIIMFCSPTVVPPEAQIPIS
jgi:hypothetical protein